jgi:hypothetical protein
MEKILIRFLGLTRLEILSTFKTNTTRFRILAGQSCRHYHLTNLDTANARRDMHWIGAFGSVRRHLCLLVLLFWNRSRLNLKLDQVWKLRLVVFGQAKESVGALQAYGDLDWFKFAAFRIPLSIMTRITR